MDQFNLKELLNFLPVAIAIAEDSGCQKITVNEAMARLMGTFYDEKIQPNASFLSSPLYKMCHNGKLLEADDLPLRRAVKRGEIVRDFQMHLIRPDGSVVSMAGYARPWKKQGQITGGIAAYVNTTALSQASAEIKLLKDHLSELMSRSSERI